MCEGQSQTTSVGINLRKIITCFSIIHQEQNRVLLLIYKRESFGQKYHT